MKIIYLIRNPKSGFSIQKVFNPIIDKIAEFHDVEIVYMSSPKTTITTLIWNMLKVFSIRNKADIFHITGEIHYLSYVLPANKTIVTIHDIGLIDVFNGIKRRIWKIIWVDSLRKPLALTFISERTQKEIEKYVDISEKQYKIIENPLSNIFRCSTKVFKLEKPVILHIGTGVNKNLERSILALHGIKCHLRIIGHISDSIRALLENNKIEFSCIYNISDEEIYQEYINCDIVNFPSYHEGFGMPIIEGQSVGRIVITSCIEPMLSVSGKCAIIVDPYNIESIRNGYLSAINNSDYRESLIKLGYENVKRFNLKLIAAKYLELYNSMNNNYETNSNHI